MKILLQNSLFFPDLIGGAERVVWELARRLSAKGHEVDVLTSTGKRGRGRPVLREREVEGVAGRVFEGPSAGLVDVLPAPDTPPPGILARGIHHFLNVHSPAWLGLAHQAVARSRPDVLHTHTLVGMTAAVWRAATAKGVPVVHTCHDLHLLCPRTTLLRSSQVVCEAPRWPCRLLSRLKLGRTGEVAVVTAPSRFNLELHLAAGGFGRARAMVVPNGQEFPAADPGPRPDRTTVHGVFLGTLAAYKGVGLLLEALDRLFADPAAAALRFAFAGAGDLAAEVGRFCRRWADRCEYLGTVHGQQKDRILRRSDFLVVPSICLDNFPLAVLDGFGYGLPVIGTDRGGIPEVVRHDREGQIVPPETQGLAAAISRYLQDSPLRLAHGERARQRAREYTLEKR